MVMKIDGNGVLDPHSAGSIQVGVSATASNNFVLSTTGAGGFKISRGNIGATTQDIFVADSFGRVTMEGGFTTGDFKHTMRTTAPTGWISATGGTIGSVASNASNRANDDTQALFILWWGQFNDAQLPIYTSAGVLSTRGASAAADWAANKKLAVFDARDRVVRTSGTSFAVGSSYASTTQSHQHKMPIGFDGGPMGYLWGDGSGSPVFGSSVETGAWRATFAPSSFGSASVRVAYTENSAGSASGESAPNTIAMLGCFKL